MSAQVLHCAGCSRQWTRQPVRGRKPSLCPSCKRPVETAAVVPVVETRACVACDCSDCVCGEHS